MTAVRQLGYLGLEVSDPGAWEAFATNVLGLEVARRGDDGTVALRMDQYEHRLFLQPGPSDDVAYLGFEVSGEAELEALGERLAQAGCTIGETEPACRAQRRVGRLLRTADPNGVSIELYCGPSLAKDPFKSDLVESGFVAGDEGLGHVVICAADQGDTEHFYIDLLGLRLSDQVKVPTGNGATFDITFLHANQRHHSLGFMCARTPKRLHHFMLEVGSVDDVGRARDRAVEAGAKLSMDLGKHPNDRMLSFYFKTPSGFDVEVGSGGVKVDDATWSVRTYDRPSLWGHKRPAQT